VRLDGSFWSAFASCSWEQRPTVLRDVAGAPLLDADELLAALQAASAAWRAGAEPMFGLWVDGQIPRPPYDRFLAEPCDRTLTNYVRRVVDDDVELCLVQFDLQHWWPPAMERVQEFARGLTDQLGLPICDIDVDAFVGRYRQTPRGIHRDPASTFMFVVQGEKCITVWPPETYRPETHHLIGAGGKYVVHGLDPVDAPAGRDLVGRQGDVLYWPSTYWHVGTEIDATAVTAAVNVGLFVAPRTSSLTGDIVDAILRDAAAQGGHSNLYEVVRSGSSVLLPARERSLLDLLTNLVSTRTLERLVHAQWMHRVTAGGVTATPALQAIAGDLPSRVARRGQGTILWYVDGDHVLVSAGGHGERVELTTGVLALLATAAARQPGEQIDLVGLVADDPSAVSAARWLLATGVLAQSGVNTVAHGCGGRRSAQAAGRSL
jgi:50S ribosomal protein L16 3-hydroxylase